jgi:uncharacterized membrane protein
VQQEKGQTGLLTERSLSLEVFAAEWLNLLIRWAHMVVAIGWIGTSFYFMALDYTLEKKGVLNPGVMGIAWQVHGGGFYHVEKYTVAPPALPDILHWFKWEAYLTWVTGFGLLIVQYYFHADAFLIDPGVLPLQPWQAIAISIGSLAAGWFIYDGLCRSKIGESTVWLAILVFALILVASVLFTKVFSGRGAFIHVGALVGTIMAVNVFGVIIPGQKKMIAQMIAGEKPDPHYGIVGKQRSTHNNYLTLPVIFLMLSNHYPLAWSSRYSVGIIGLVVIAGAIVRHFFNSQHAGKGSPWWTWAVAAACMAGAVYLSIVGKPGNENLAQGPAVTLASAGPTEEALQAIQSRCSMCHAGEPVWDGITQAPKGVRLDTPEEIARHAEAIRVQAVLTHAMPPNNLTEMTLDERRAVATWLAGRDRALR